MQKKSICRLQLKWPKCQLKNISYVVQVGFDCTNTKILVGYGQLPGRSCLFKNLYRNFSSYYWNIQCKIYHQYIVSFWQLLGIHQLLFRSDQGHFIILQQQKITIPSFLPYHPYTSSPIINITPANLFFLSPQPTRPCCSLVKNSFNL